MDSCVDQLMADPDFKPWSGKTKKQSAVAVCHNTIMGKPKKSLKGGEKNMSDDKILDEFEKVDDEVIEEKEIEKQIAESMDDSVEKGAYQDCMKEQLKAGKPFMEAVKYCKTKTKKTEEEEEEEEEEEKKKKPKEEEEEEEKGKKKPEKEEEEEEKKKKPKEYEEYGEKATSAVSILEEALKKDEIEDVKTAIREAIKALKEGYGKAKPKKEEEEEEEEKKKPKKEEYGYGYPAPKKIEELLVSFSAKLDEMKSLIKQAPAEGAAEITPKVEAKEAPKEEVKKADTSSEGASEIIKVLAQLKERVENLEKSPAPSRVVVSKGFTGETGESDELTKINDRLIELEKIKMKEPGFYMKSGLVNEAFDLIAKKKTLKK